MFRVQRYSVPSPPWRTRLTEVYVIFENTPLEEYGLPAERILDCPGINVVYFI